MRTITMMTITTITATDSPAGGEVGNDDEAGADDGGVGADDEAGADDGKVGADCGKTGAAVKVV